MTTPSVATTPKYRDLLTWARSHGATIPSTLLFLSEPYGHCRTTIPLPAGTELFHIPHTLIITPSVATSALPQLKDSSVHERLCAFLAIERRKEGFWKEYLRSLPRWVRTPAYFGNDALETFKGTNLAFAWKDKVKVWEEEFKHAKELVLGLEWKDYLWAATVVSSRSFPSRLMDPLTSASPAVAASTYIALSADLSSEIASSPGQPGDSTSDPILIPVMDMLNHRPNHPVTWLTSSNNITLVAETDYPVNTEVFNNYGAKGNEEQDNPYDSISLKLPFPFDETLYMITRNNLVPQNLIQTFCDVQPSSAREILSSKYKTRRRRYLGLCSLYNALCPKLVALGVGRDMKYASLAAKFAEIYRQGQQDLYMASLQRLVKLMDEMVHDRTISANDMLRKRTGKRMKTDINDGMKRWLAIQIRNFRTPAENNGSGTNDTEEDENVSVEQIGYLRKLVELVYGKMSGWEHDGLMESEVLEIHEELTEDQLTVDIKDVARALELWEEESTRVYWFPDIKEVYAGAHDGKVQGRVELDALESEIVDEVIFMDDEIKETRPWHHDELTPGWA